MLAHKIKDGKCPNCGEKAVYSSTEENSSIWKVYVKCEEDDGGCGRDFGRVGVIKRSNIDHTDQMHEKAEKIAEKFVD
ncbi:hypothetical protein KY092_07880 [Natronomonas gomsonensis]|uniref:hypothetical protein n=1 Tax=Natronomonas gomsonensis TaxID=1046043 RepID=UPI0020CA8C98|nr:hypothetical protein [Natronomonas gomsonensis]MCY4730475.1 hypothetical protein [Natronomonas gomsonensis]